jgi:hypothetical protein
MRTFKMRKVAMTEKTWTKAIIDLGQLGCAALLLVAPWIFDFASEAVAAWNAWLSGCAILAAAAMALVAEAQWEQETNLALGVWVVVAPSVLGFPGHASAALVHVWLTKAYAQSVLADRVTFFLDSSGAEPAVAARRDSA